MQASLDQLQAYGDYSVVRFEPPTGKSASGLLLPDGVQNWRMGIVEQPAPNSALLAGDRIVRQVHNCVRTEDYRLLLRDDQIWCLIVDDRLVPLPPRTDTGRMVGTVMVLVDPLTEREKMIPESARKRGYLLGTDNTLKGATVLDATPFDQRNGRVVKPFNAGDRVWVRPDVYHCLQVLPHDLDLPFANVPDGQDMRIYKGTLETVMYQIPGLMEMEAAA